jgi:hypothetical protein
MDSKLYRIRELFSLMLLIAGGPLSTAAAQPEEVIFFDARADQTATTNGGTAIWSLATNTWRWWFKNVEGAAVSPNGKSVVYQFGTNLYITNIKGQNPRLLATGAQGAKWSPRGDKIAFTAYGGLLRIVSFEGDLLHSYQINGGGLSWSPDGRRIAFLGGVMVDDPGCGLFSSGCPGSTLLSTVFSIDVASGNTQQLFEPTVLSVALGGQWIRTTRTELTQSPCWSPDGSHIAAALHIMEVNTRPPEGSGLPDGGWLIKERNVVTIPSSGGDFTRLTSDLTPFPHWEYLSIQNFPRSWSPDGRLFISRIRGSASVPASEQGTFVISPGGTSTKVNGFVAASLQWALLNQSGITVEIQLPKTNFLTGEAFEATIEVKSLEDNPQTVTFVESVLESEDQEVLAVPEVALPPPAQLTPQNWIKTFTVPVQAIAAGETDLVTTIQVEDSEGGTLELTARIPVKVVPAGDLLVKRAKEPVSAFAANDVYETMLDGRQYRFVAHAMRDTNRFNVRIENDSREPAAFVLRAIAPSAENWQIVYRYGDTDITASVFSTGGWTTPELAAGAHTDVLLQLHDIAGDHGDRVRVRSEISSGDEPEAIDAVIVALGIVEVPVETELQRVTASGYTAPSIAAGETEVDAPLELVTSKSVLEAQPVIYGGWVADGVTPMLLKLTAPEEALEPFPEGRQFRVDVEIEAGGTIEGVALADRLKLLKNGSWTAENEFELSPGAPAMFAMFTPIASDELTLTTDRQLTINLTVVDIVSEDVVSEATLRLRKPPVALIHGYNTDGNWGDQFIRELARSRPISGDYPWVHIARYGTNFTTGYVEQMVNTLGSLADLVPLAEQSLEDAIAPLRENWAFTRYDVVCHSQGGLLTRMLCSQRTSRTLSQPFRNESNHYRGRFHRVVTVGSPHNGTRLLRYLLALDEAGYSLLKNNLPILIGRAGVTSETAQAKFDPFGPEIRDLNNPSPDSRWQPDPAAKFHLVRSTINLGLPPHAEDLAPSYRALGLFHPVAGTAVLPRGSDGVVDFDSMGAHAPGQSVGANVFTLSPTLLVSHSGPLWAFGSDSGQTASPDVGAHVIAALDQDPNTPPSARVFSSFVVPQLLDDSIRQQIDQWANASVFELLDSAINPPPALPGLRSIVTTNLEFVLTTPVNRPVVGLVSWAVESFTTNGINSGDIAFTVDPADSRRVTVHVPSNLIGDVVLYAHYLSTNGTVVLVAPREIYSAEPEGVSLVGIAVEPDGISLPVGAEVPIQLATRYSDGQVIVRHVTPGEVTAISSATNVVSTTNSTAWRLLSPGMATITVNYLGQTATNQLTVFAPIPSDAPSLSALAQTGQIILRWPATATDYVLESALTLAAGGVWQTVTNAPVVVGQDRVVTNTTTGSQRYYRLRQF